VAGPAKLQMSGSDGPTRAKSLSTKDLRDFGTSKRRHNRQRLRGEAPRSGNFDRAAAQPTRQKSLLIWSVELIGIEPTTSSMPCRRRLRPVAFLTQPRPVAGLQTMRSLRRIARVCVWLRGEHRALSQPQTLNTFEARAKCQPSGGQQLRSGSANSLQHNLHALRTLDSNS
jgi:hypothetical protein